MNIATLLLPDFLLILSGFVLRRMTNWGDQFWSGMEKLVYFVLFPALLFNSTAHTVLDFSATGKVLQVSLVVTLSGVLLGWLGKPLFKAGPMMFESGLQTAFRFNSYIALAAASRLAGDHGAAIMALLIGFSVPLANMAAVHALVHRSGGLLKELLKNPLIIATASGLAWNFCGFTVPEVVGVTLSRMGAASIALGLLLVGAGLQLSGLAQSRALAAWFLAVKLLALPALALLLARWLALPLLQLQLVVAFAALPTASSAYVLAARLGGNPPFVAFLISAGTLLSILTL